MRHWQCGAPPVLGALLGAVRPAAVRERCVVLSCVLIWYATATATTVLSKFMLEVEGGNFRYPFFMLAASNVFVSAFAFTLSRKRSLRVPLPTRRRFLLVAVPIGLGTALDVGFSNWSLSFLSISFHVILKGVTPLFVFAFGLLFGLHRFSARIPLALALIVSGLFLVASDRMALPNRWQGVLLGVLGSFFSGLRWALSQVLMDAPPGAASEREGSLARPLGVMLHTAPVCVLGGILLSRMLEPGAISALIESPSPATLVGGLSLIAALVTLMVLSEFYLVKMTSSLTLAVLAVFKALSLTHKPNPVSTQVSLSQANPVSTQV